MIKRLLLGILLVGIVGLGTAGAVTLGSLAISGGTVVSGDKTFSNFSCIINAPTNGGVNATPFTCNDINVVPIGPGTSPASFDGNLGLLFTGSMDFNNSGPNTSVLDFVINYRVTAPSNKITDIGLFVGGIAFGGNCNNSPNCNVSIGETALDHDLSGANAHASVSVNDNDLSDPPGELSDKLLFGTPLRSVDVTKDVRLQAIASGRAGISDIQQTFSQTAIPEPRTAALMLGFGLAIALWRKKSAKAAA
jgi:hypothetical protein